MTEEDGIRCFCGNCGREMAGERHVSGEARVPCPSCGSLGRNFTAVFTATVEVGSCMEYKARSSAGEVGGLSNRRVFCEGRVGQYPSSCTREGWADVDRVIDRKNDLYKERVVAPDGSVLRDVEERLSDHQCRGSAKKGGAGGHSSRT